ncbi:MAG TPA: DUF748 domain-containing protein [Urbifossiella sp.]|nr:DUF748 domain-containing protein [Urbifossiella sp.]
MSHDPAPPPAPEIPPPAPTRRRWKRRVLGFVVLLAVVVWFAPLAVAKTELRNRIAAAAAADLRGTVTIGGMSGGWLSVVELRDVVVTDRQGRTVMTIPHATTSKSLVGFLRDRSDLGTIEIHDPVVDIACETGVTNLEEMIAEYLKDDGRPPAPTRPAIQLQVSGGTLNLNDSAAGRTATFTGVALTAAVPADRSTPVEIAATATAAGVSPGTIEVKAAVGAGGSAEVKAAGFPLASLAALLPRAQPGLVLAGSVTADLKGQWAAGETTSAGLDGTIGVQALDVSGPALKGDRLVVPAADVALKTEVTGGTVRFRITGGRLVLADDPAGRPVEFTAITADVTAPVGGKGDVTASVGVSTVGPTPGRLDAEAVLADRGTAKLRATGFPLAALAPVLRRLDPGASLSGTLTADVTAGWEESGKAARVEGKAGVRDLDVAGPWLKGDRLRLAAADLPIKAEIRGHAVRVEKADLTCDVGHISVAGAVDPSDPPERLLDRPGVKIEADIDLARLAALVPNLLRVREGTAVREGKLGLSLVSVAGKDGTTWNGAARTSALKAERDGKAVEWPEPLSVEFSARAPAGHPPVFDKLLCKSDFIAVNAQGSSESVRAAANVYLDRLTTRLGEFVDLGGVTLSGEASAWVVASRTPAGVAKADAGAELKNFVFARPGVRGLSEPRLTLKASAAGVWPKDGPVRLDTASIEVVAGADEFDARVMESVPAVRAAAGGKVAVHLVGDLGRWVDRARGFVSVPPEYQFGGTINASGTLTLEPLAVTGDRLAVAVTNARFRGAGLDLNEPTLTAAGPMNFNRKTGELVFTPVAITSPTLIARDARFVFEFPAAGPMAISGAGTAEGDLNRLASTLQLQTEVDGPGSLHGKGVGPVRFRWQGDTTTFGGTLDVTDFAAGPKARPAVRDPQLKLDLDGRYDQSAERLTLTTGHVQRPGLAVEGKGTWSKFDTTQDVDLSGTLTYDLAVLSPELRNAVGGGFQATGKGSRPFALRGSLNPPGAAGSLAGLAANGAAAWEGVRAFGFEMGPAELTARVANGVGAISPVSATFGGGRVNLQPTVKLGPGPGELSFAKGRIVDKAKMTPAVCAGAIGYALPVVANAAQAEGEVSFDLDDNRIPLADFTGAALRGKVQVHRAAVSAGPVVSEVMKLIGEPAPRVVLANEMAVPVRVEAGRVYHENLALTVNGYSIKTSGSVGFDGTLALVADVPIPGTFPGLKNNPTLKTALDGKAVKVPIGGTMTHPAVDHGAFSAAVAAVARDAAKNAVQGAGRDLLHRELNQLFPGGTPGVMPGGTPPAQPPAGRPSLFGLPIPKL